MSKCCVLKDVRQFIGYSQKYFAEMVGITRDELLQIESGKLVPDDKVKDKFAYLLGCNVVNIFPEKCSECHKKHVLECDGKLTSEHMG